MFKTVLISLSLLASTSFAASTPQDYLCNEGQLGEHTPVKLKWSEENITLDGESGPRLQDYVYEYSIMDQFRVVISGGKLGDDEVQLKVYDTNYTEVLKEMKCGKVMRAIFAAGICYNRTYNCRGSSLGWLPSAQACFNSGGLSFKDSDGTCTSNEF